MFDNFKINYVWNQVTFNQAVMQISGSLSEYYLKNSLLVKVLLEPLQELSTFC